MSDKILCGSFIRSGSGFEYSHMDGKMAASWPIQFMEGTRHGIKQKKNMVTEDDKKKNRMYMILNGSVQLINSLNNRVS
jgi:hypothetical protein